MTANQLNSLLAHGRITYDLLWAFFKPGALMYTTCPSTGLPRCIRYSTVEETKTIRKGDCFEIQGLYFLNVILPYYTTMDGPVVLVSGGSKGIGRSIVLRAIAEDASVRLELIEVDISKIEEVDRLGEAVISRFGKIDVLIPNAAYVPASDIETITEEQFDRTLAVNVREPYPHMPLGRTIIFISSDLIDYNALPPQHLLYISTKAALNQMMRVLAQSLAKQNIRVNAISPGATGIASYYFFYFFWGPYATALSLPMANTSGHTKKVTVNAMVFLAYCVANILAPQTEGDLTDWEKPYFRYVC
ncbi:hypothetical protein BDW59DRAFT_164761 [Aspergillus cavernicola]|uniref:DUF7025 domain-containing protein n=1 Tax=Aspergillus cavernicola TaxID=176166 RepID=A0ABR4HXC6_9EURO